jgi:hypothetical protein
MIKELRLSTSSGLGAVTIFAVLLILCLTVFSVLTLASAQADLRLTEKNALMVSSYYRADNEACNISDLLTSFWPEGAVKPEPVLCLALEERIKGFSQNIIYAAVNERESGFIAEYGVAVDTNLNLEVSIMMPEGGICNVLEWRMSPIEQAFDEGPLSVWLGGQESVM